MVVLKCGGAHFQRDFNVHATSRKGNDKKGKQSKSWPECAGKGKSKEGEGDGKSEEKFEGSKGAKGSYKGKTSKIDLSGLENPKPETCSETHSRICTDVSH